MPTYDVLNIHLRSPIKSNLTSVTSNLGGGDRIHLVFSITAAHYAAVTNSPYVRHVHLGSNESVYATQHETLTEHDNWKTNLVLFKVVVDV